MSVNSTAKPNSFYTNASRKGSVADLTHATETLTMPRYSPDLRQVDDTLKLLQQSLEKNRKERDGYIQSAAKGNSYNGSSEGIEAAKATEISRRRIGYQKANRAKLTETKNRLTAQPKTWGNTVDGAIKTTSEWAKWGYSKLPAIRRPSSQKPSMAGIVQKVMTKKV